jgi:hypothetical protein
MTERDKHGSLRLCVSSFLNCKWTRGVGDQCHQIQHLFKMLKDSRKICLLLRQCKKIPEEYVASIYQIKINLKT